VKIPCYKDKVREKAMSIKDFVHPDQIVEDDYSEYINESEEERIIRKSSTLSADDCTADDLNFDIL